MLGNLAGTKRAEIEEKPWFVHPGIDRYCRQSLRYCFQAVHTVPKLQLAKAALGESLSFTNLLLVLVDIMPLTMGC